MSGFDFLAIYNEARTRFLKDATCPIDIQETLAKVAFEHGQRAERLKSHRPKGVA